MKLIPTMITATAVVASAVLGFTFYPSDMEGSHIQKAYAGMQENHVSTSEQMYYINLYAEKQEEAEARDETGDYSAPTDGTVRPADEAFDWPKKNDNPLNTNPPGYHPIELTEDYKRMYKKAVSVLGLPYRFGGRSLTDGADCSGFVSLMMELAGTPVPQGTTTQVTKGVAVPEGQERPGDIVFFVNTYRPGISHVGIYLGKGMMIHTANERDGVIIQQVHGPYYGPRFHSFRRIHEYQ